MTNLIGVDLGNKRVWLAISTEWIAIPHSVVARVEIVKVLKKLINERQPEALIIWLPYDLYWIDTTQLDRTKKFIVKLKNIFPDIKIIGQDERYSSQESEQTLMLAWKKYQNQYKDDIAAALILESYLRIHKNIH